MKREAIETTAGPSAPGKPSTGFAPGSVIADKYEVVRDLASGGVGTVALATHVDLGHHVAIKYLQPGRESDPMLVARFKREGRLAASLRSEHIVRVHDVGTLEDGAPFMVMEYLEGEDLSAVLRREGARPVDVAVRWTMQACSALVEAHAHGIIHRDLKPANLFLAERPNAPPIVKIVDFGISKIGRASTLSKDSPAMTLENESFGTPFYMSPEQIVSSANVDERSDIYAMGVVLYELLTARLPFEGMSLHRLVADILSASARPIRSLRPEIPIELSALIHACLSSDPSARPSDIRTLVDRLAPFADAPAPRAREERSRKALFGAVGGVSLLLGAGIVVAGSLLRAAPVHARAHAAVVAAAPAPRAAPLPRPSRTRWF